MRKFLMLLGLAVLTLILVATGLSTSYAQDDAGYSGRPPDFTPGPAVGPEVVITPVPSTGPGKGSPNTPRAFGPVSMFGMNLYLTGLERWSGGSSTQASVLAQSAAAGGVKWSREEISWANLEVFGKGRFDTNALSIYDQALSFDVNNGMNVVGMLLTTPKWASTNPNAGDYYWYEPANFNDYYDFVRFAVTRWKDKVHTWEIWNEPNSPNTWNCPNNCNRAADYARLLQRAYNAVKSVDPNARVLIGGLYVHDTDNEGMAFLNGVVAASNGAINFDGMSIHTYMPDRIPESIDPTAKVQNFQYRLNMVNDWIDAHGGKPSEIWITEDGRSTSCPSCPPSMVWSEDAQASMLARMYGIAMATRRVVQFDYFQFEDKFNYTDNLYGGMAIVTYNSSTHTVSPKPAYYAYKTMSGLLDGATFAGTGTQMVPGGSSQQPDNSDYVGFDYKFSNAGKTIEMLWRTDRSVGVEIPVGASSVDVIDRDGAVTHMTTSNGKITLTVSPRPQYVVYTACPARFSDVPCDYWAYPYVECLASRNILTGYSDGTFGPSNQITRGQLAKVVSNAAGFGENHTEQTFADIAPGSTFYQYIQRLASRNIISGYTCGGPGEPCDSQHRPYFRQNANTTRGQIAKIVAAAKGYTDNPTGQTFQDVPPGSTFYKWVQQLASRNIMSGYQCGGPGEPCVNNLPYFRPGANATRAQVAKIVANAFFPNCAP